MATLRQGSVASVLALVGVFGAFWLTRRHDLERDRLAAQAEEARQRSQRLSESITTIVAASARIRSPTGDLYQQAADLSNALTLFSVEVITQHPSTSRWAMEQSSEILRCANQQDRAMQATSWQAGNLTAALVEWSRRDCPDGFLRPSEPEKPVLGFDPEAELSPDSPKPYDPPRTG